jgi:hypothetical protein
MYMDSLLVVLRPRIGGLQLFNLAPYKHTFLNLGLERAQTTGSLGRGFDPRE